MVNPNGTLDRRERTHLETMVAHFLADREIDKHIGEENLLSALAFGILIVHSLIRIGYELFVRHTITNKTVFSRLEVSFEIMFVASWALLFASAVMRMTTSR